MRQGCAACARRRLRRGAAGAARGARLRRGRLDAAGLRPAGRERRRCGGDVGDGEQGRGSPARRGVHHVRRHAAHVLARVERGRPRRAQLARGRQRRRGRRQRRARAHARRASLSTAADGADGGGRQRLAQPAGGAQRGQAQHREPQRAAAAHAAAGACRAVRVQLCAALLHRMLLARAQPRHGRAQRRTRRRRTKPGRSGGDWHRSLLTADPPVACGGTAPCRAPRSGCVMSVSRTAYGPARGAGMQRAQPRVVTTRAALPSAPRGSGSVLPRQRRTRASLRPSLPAAIVHTRLRLKRRPAFSCSRRPACAVARAPRSTPRRSSAPRRRRCRRTS